MPALRRKQVGGFRFRRQHILGRLIVDFYCSSIRLVVEVDGPIHRKQAPYDEERTRWLEERGHDVIRFKNGEELTEMEQVLEQIRAVCEQRVK